LTSIRLPAFLAFTLIMSACAESPAVEVRPQAPVAQQVALVASTPEPALTYEPIESREPPPLVGLSTGRTAHLFEEFDHSRFSDPSVIDNRWLPMRPGTRMVYEGFTREDGETIQHRLVFTVTDLVKNIDGVLSRVIWDVDYSDGELVETELAFFAQDDRGSVWRMGEYPEEWEEGEFIDAPAWIAGVEGARAGIAMPASPAMGAASYSQGWGPAVDFTDRAYVWEAGIDDCVRVDCYSDVLVINEFNEDEPDANQLKYYAKGVGNIRVGWRGDDTSIEELELVEIIQLTAEELAEIRKVALTLEERAYILKPQVYGPTERTVPQG
jgi:hypothetical protein